MRKASGEYPNNDFVSSYNCVTLYLRNWPKPPALTPTAFSLRSCPWTQKRTKKKKTDAFIYVCGGDILTFKGNSKHDGDHAGV